MPLTEQDRQQLDNIVIRLQERGTDDTQIQAVVDEFKQKYDTPSKSLGRKALEFVGKATGITGFGKGLAGAAHLLSGANKQKEGAALAQAEKSQSLIEQARKLPTGSPERKRLLKEAMAAGNAGSSIAQGNIDTLGKIPTAKAMLGSTAKTLATVGAFGVGAPAGATASARIGQAALTSGGLGAVQGAGTAMEENRGLGDIAKAGVIGGAAGALVGGAVQGGVEAVRGLGVLGGKVAKNPLKAPAKTAKQDLEEVYHNIKKYGLSGKIETIKAQADAVNKEMQGAVNQALSAMKGGATRKQAAQAVQQYLNTNNPGKNYTVAQVEAVMQKIVKGANLPNKGGTIPWQNLNDIRVAAQKAANPKAWMGGGFSGSANQEMAKGVADGLRLFIKNKTGTHALFDKWSDHIGISRVLGEVLKRNETTGLGVMDIGSIMAGASAGGPIGGVVGPIATRILRSPTVDLNAGMAAEALARKAVPILQKLSQAERAILVPLVQQAVVASGSATQAPNEAQGAELGAEEPFVPATQEEVEEANRAMVQALVEYGMSNAYDILAYVEQNGGDMTLEQIKQYMGQ